MVVVCSISDPGKMDFFSNRSHLCVDSFCSSSHYKWFSHAQGTALLFKLPSVLLCECNYIMQLNDAVKFKAAGIAISPFPCATGAIDVISFQTVVTIAVCFLLSKRLFQLCKRAQVR